MLNQTHQISRRNLENIGSESSLIKPITSSRKQASLSSSKIANANAKRNLLSSTQRQSPGKIKPQTSRLELKTKEILDHNLLDEIAKLQEDAKAASEAAEQAQAQLMDENRALKEKLASLSQQQVQALREMQEKTQAKANKWQEMLAAFSLHAGVNFDSKKGCGPQNSLSDAQALREAQQRLFELSKNHLDSIEAKDQ